MPDQSVQPPDEFAEARERAKPDSDGEGIDIQGDIQIDGDLVGGDKRVGQVQGSTSDVIGGDKIVEDDAGESHDTVHGNKYTTLFKIGNFNVDTRFLIGLLIVAAIVSLAAWLYFVPTQMPFADQNIAIADFGQTDASGNVTPSTRGSDLSEWLFERMQLFAADKSNLPPDERVTLWHDSMSFLQKRANVGLIRNEAEAAAKAKELNANIVVYGNLKPGQTLDTFEPLFYVNKDLAAVQTAEADELTGTQELGEALSISYPLNTSYLTLQLEPRGRALVWFVTGIGYDLVGAYHEAYQVFCQGKHTLSRWEDSQGKEVLYYFLGREALFLARTDEIARKTLSLPDNWGSRQPDEAGMRCEPFQDAASANAAAEMWFKRAQGINGEYARAYFGLGQVYNQRANNVLRTRPTDPAVLEQARTDLRAALERFTEAQKWMLPVGETGNAASLINLKTIGAMGTSYVQLANSYTLAGDRETALENLKLAEVQLQSLVQEGVIPKKEERLLAQTYYGLGAAQWLQGNTLEGQATALLDKQADAEAQRKFDAEKTVMQAAAANFTQCLAIADPAKTVDQLLLSDTGPKCKQALDAVNGTLAKLD